MAESGRERAAWATLALVAGAIAVAAIARWVWAVSLGGPVLYGEGAVAHAALLSRDGLEYTTGAALLDGPLRPIFTAANYPPLYLRIAGLGDPFVAGRVASIAATLFVAGAIAWHARRAGALVALAIAAAWMATFPVIVWGAVVKPDLVALAFTVAGVLALASPKRRPLVAGVLLAVAVWTKPTALLPAVALGVWCSRERGTAASRYALGSVSALLILGFILVGPMLPVSVLERGHGFGLHVISWNALSWTAEQAVLLAVLGLLTIGPALLGLARLGAFRGPIAAYALGGVGILLLGGREGATVNYLLDLSAAGALAAADAARRLRVSGVHPAAAAQALIAFQLLAPLTFFDPFGAMPARPSTGAWGDPARVDAVRRLAPGPALVEDAGLLLAVGREPIVDDLFLFSRLRQQEVDGRRSFLEGQRLLDAVAERRFTSIVSEADLERIDQAPAFERARWHPDLVRAVLDGYTLDRRDAGLWVYRPR